MPESPHTQSEVSQDGSTYLFRINGIRYRLVGVKEVFVLNLRVNIKAEYEGERFYDNLDLYSARSRSSYSQNLAHLFGLELKIYYVQV